MTDQQQSLCDDEHRADQAAKRGVSRRSADDLGRNARAVLQLVRDNPDRTARQISDLAGWDTHKYLPDLEHEGFIERVGTYRDAITGREAATWRAK